MKIVLMFVGGVILIIIITQLMIQVVFKAVYGMKSKKLNKFSYLVKEKLAQERAQENYNAMNDFDLTNIYRKLLKEDSRNKDLKTTAEIGCRLDMIEEIMLKRGIEIPKY